MTGAKMSADYHAGNASKQGLIDNFKHFSGSQLEDMCKDSSARCSGLINDYVRAQDARNETYELKNVKAIMFEDAEDGFVVDVARKIKRRFFLSLTENQFQTLMKSKKFDNFFTVARINEFAEALKTKNRSGDAAKYFKHITVGFLDKISNAAALHPSIMKHIKPELVNKIAKPFHKENGKHMTKEMLAKYDPKKAKAKLDTSDIPNDMIKHLSNPKAVQKSDLTKDQMESLLPSQTSDLIKKTKTCHKLKVDKIKKIEDVEFDDESAEECFAALPTEVQTLFLIKHGKLPKKIASRVTKDMVKNWSAGDFSGVEMFHKIKNQAIVPFIGSHEDIDVDNHHCSGLDFDDFKKAKTLTANMTNKCLEAMKIELPTKLDQLKKHAEYYCGIEGIFEAIQEIDGKKSEKATEAAEKAAEKAEKKGEKVEAAASTYKSFWATLDKDLAKKLFGPAHSVLAAEMTKAAFALIPEEVLSEFSPASVASLTFLKELKKETYAKLAENAFAAISAKHVGAFRLADVTDAQYPQVSAQATESFFSKVSVEELSKEEARFGLCVAKQVAALPAKTFQAVMTKSTIAKVTPEATELITAEQLKGVTSEVIAAITAAQVEVLGSKIADEKLSGLAVLLANKNFLSAEARAALEKRVPGSSAARATFSMAAAAAVAALALLA